MYPQLRSGFRLGSFDVLPLQNEIVGQEGTRHIQPKAMDVLCCLVVHAGDVVEREAILGEVWERNVVADDVLTRCISELRHALGDTVAGAQYIQTVPKRGYRLVAETGALAPTPEATSAAPAQHAPRSFWEEIKQRSVVRVGLAYAAVAWLVIEVAETIFPYLHLPESLNSFIVIVALIGLPIALALAWVFEITPGGIVVDRSGAASPEAVASPEATAPPGPTRLRRLDVLTLSALAILIAFMAYQFLDGTAPAVTSANTTEASATLAGAPSRKSIAIMPFQNFSGTPDKEYFGDGLAEDLIHLLTKARKLRVSPRAASFFYKDKDVALETIAERLKVGTILTGSVRISDEQIIVTVSLQDLQTASTLWTQRIERPLGDVFALQNEIAEAVVQNLRIELDAAEVEPQPYRTPTEILGAYQFFSQAREYLRRPVEESNVASAEALLERALELDPGYADAYALMCEANLARYELSYVSESVAFESAERHCFRAKTLDDTNPNVFVALGSLYRIAGRYNEAIDELRAALKQSPFLVAAQLELGLTLSDKRDFERAEAELRRAIDMDPGYFESYKALANMFFARQKYAEASEYFKAVTDLTPSNQTAFSNLASAYFMLNDFERASAAWERSLELGGTRSTFTNLGLSNYYSGNFKKAVDMQRRAVEITPTDHRIWGRLAEAARFVDGLKPESDAAYRKAIEYAKTRLRVNSTDWETLGLLALYQAHVDPDAALTTLGKGLALATDQPDMHYFAALVYLQLDQQDPAYTELRTSLDLGFSPRLVRADPDILPLLEQERFQALLAP